MFPVRHNFSYSYLLAGIPIGFKGSIAGLLSVDEGKDKGWFTVDGDDYLARGHHPDGLKGKLQEFLKSRSIDSTQYSHAYLFTAAKFLNYSSNPVSIWHLYSREKMLKAIILEVNNTFNERHSYFLEPSSKNSAMLLNTTQESSRYTSAWQKEFYVSTFNDLSGCYSLSMIDPFAPLLTGDGHINLNITLSGPSNKNAMIVTLLRSTSAPLDPENMSILTKIAFLSTWWWVGLATFPRTLQQAFNLFFRKKIPWVFRPEPRQNTISRTADETEKFIEEFFRAFLKYRVEEFQEEVILRYRSAGLIGEKSATCTFSNKESPQCSPYEFEIVVLTPVFYSRLPLYTDLREALVFESNQYKTILLSDHAIISKLIVQPSIHETSFLTNNQKESFTSSLLIFLSNLRKIPKIVPGHTASTIQNSKVKFPKLSEFDIFILQHAKPAQLRYYTWILASLMMIEYIAFGSPMLWELQISAFRALFLFLVIRGICI